MNTLKRIKRLLICYTFGVKIYKKAINKDETKYSTFYGTLYIQTQKKKQLFTTQTLIVHLNQSIVRL